MHLLANHEVHQLLCLLEKIMLFFLVLTHEHYLVPLVKNKVTVGITPLEKEEGEDPRRPNKDVKIRGLIED